ncbi:MAG: hypothetical protein AUG47_04180 [Alphaproteobacteria bacterium 13_1_20CM_3_64_12]|nr:MAG: hypothetical protein AUG47_04180 [Alphaproteobacteria bacterium 13_1_20CM_3_64_12]
MNDQPVSEAELQAYADGRLAAERRAAVEAWLAARPEEAERIAAYRRLAREVRAAYDNMLREPVPERLQQAASRHVLWRRIAAVAAWLGLGIALGAPAGWYARPERTVVQSAPDGAVLARRAAVAHAVYSPEVRHPVEVGADDEQHLVAWLSKRLGAKLRAPKLDEVGMSLVGGRLLPGDSGPVALFMYQSQNGRRLTLYVRTEAARNRETAFRYARENNVGVFYWIDREMGYALASAELSKDELLRLANLVYKQLEGG